MSASTRRFDGERWSLAIFSSRETATQLQRVVRAASMAERFGAAMTLDIVINGNENLALTMHRQLSAGCNVDDATMLRLWLVPQPDKAHAWNVLLHTLLPLAQRAFFMDGYVMLERDALVRMAAAMDRNPQALAATAVPSTGRSAPSLRRQLLIEGGLHGNLFALTAATCSRLRETGFRLPYGIYRNDSALGAALAFNLDPAHETWRSDRIVVVDDARYAAPVMHPWRLTDIKTALRRRLRQARGIVETRALRWHLATARRSPAAWPVTMHELIMQWAGARPADARALMLASPLAWTALERIRREPIPLIPPGLTQFLGRFAAQRTDARQRAAWLSEA